MDFGFRISRDGIDVKTGADKDMVVTSKYSTLKGTISGSGSLSVPQSNKNGDITSINTGTDFLTSVAHGLVNGNQVFIYSDGTMPAPLESLNIYYVINKTADTFQLSLTSGGSAIDITSTGSGTIYFQSETAVVITHNLGYIPMVQSFWNDSAGLYFSPDDYYSVGTYIFGFGGTDFTFNCYANSTYVYIVFSAEDYGFGGPNIDFNYAYYIFIDKGRL